MDLYLVTGAAGFIGARFIESCARKSIEVISVDQKKYFTEREEHKGIRFGTLADQSELMDWLNSESPRLKAIVHLGACSRTTEMNEKYLRENNVEYSQRLWSYATQNKIPFIYASSAATYGAGEQGYDDDETKIPSLRPLNLYGNSKQLFDLWALNEEKSRKTPPTWSGFKFFNVYGFGERHKGSQASVVLHAFDQIRKTGKMRLFKSHKPGIPDGFQARDFVSVEDAVAVMHFALEKPIQRGIYNLGSGKARTFLDLTRAVFSALKQPENIEFIDTPPEIRNQYQYFTEAKMQKLESQGYDRRFISLESGVEKYVKKLLEA